MPKEKEYKIYLLEGPSNFSLMREIMYYGFLEYCEVVLVKPDDPGEMDLATLPALLFNDKRIATGEARVRLKVKELVREIQSMSD